MKSSKIMLPILAFICAIGMSFASIDLLEAPTTGYVNIDGNWQAVQVDCGNGENMCRVKFSQNGTPHNVYESDLSTIKSSASNTPILITP